MKAETTSNLDIEEYNLIVIVRARMLPEVYCAFIKTDIVMDSIREFLNKHYNTVISAISLVTIGEISNLNYPEESRTDSGNNSLKIPSLETAKKLFGNCPKFFLDFTKMKDGWQQV